ncbi:carbohydrate sulfotransferase 13-like [Amphiura filiformis]|uniref:carbohydrate sulfotransferase 13-like n=1 Tax=Amphiura filiformis TaxID=82378 RepID=UPI003B20D1E3
MCSSGSIPVVRIMKFQHRFYVLLGFFLAVFTIAVLHVFSTSVDTRQVRRFKEGVEVEDRTQHVSLLSSRDTGLHNNAPKAVHTTLVDQPVLETDAARKLETTDQNQNPKATLDDKMEFCDEECQKYEWNQEQSRRRNTLQNACNKFEFQNNITHDVLQHILVSDKHKLLYCYVPKVACTNWKKIMLSLNGVNATEVHKTHIPNLEKMTATEIAVRLRDYRKIMIVRNPHERLLSAYNEKMVNYSPYSDGIRKHYGRIMHINNIKYFIRKYYSLYPNSTKESALLKRTLKIEEDRNTWVSFQEFLRYVSNTEYSLDEEPEEHWRQMYRLCSPCSIQYDYIGKLETIADDTKYILSQIGADGLASVMETKPHATNSSNEEKVQNMYQQVTEEDVLKFEKRFEKDMALFGYERPKAITSLRTEAEDLKHSMGKLEYLFYLR